MSNNLTLLRSFPSLPTGCCHDALFAHVFNEQGEALKLVTGAWSFVAYDKTISDQYAIPLSEDAERTQSFSAVIAEGDLTLPDTPDGEVYEIEYWRVTSGSPAPPYVRVNSTLLEVVPFVWYQHKMMQGSMSLGDAQRAIQEEYVVQVSVAYNADVSTIQFTAWLEVDGIRATDTQNCNILMLDSTGSTILNSTQATPVTGFPGLFAWSITNIPLNADTSYTIFGTMLDAGSNLRSTTCAAVTWD